MKLKRFFSGLLAFLLAAMSFSACAEQNLQAQMQDLYTHNCAGESLQEWIDRELSESAGETSDSYIISLSRLRSDLDLSGYAARAAERLQTGEISNPVTRMRCALSLIACGKAELMPEGLADECIGKLGVMSYVFGLHLLNNGAESRLWTRESILTKLFELQKADGGWAVMGANGDVDVTAMCLQALACCERSEALDAAISKGVNFLVQRQQNSAGFSSYGKENSESAAQVITALTALGIDPAADSRFIRSGRTIMDAMLSYRLDGGGYSHLYGEAENHIAGAQVLQALTAIQQSSPYYDLSAEPEIELEIKSKPALLPAWKICALCIILALMLAGCIFALTRRHGRMKQLIFMVIAALIAAGAVLMLNIETPDAYYSEVDKASVNGKVYLSIRCDRLSGKSEDAALPKDGLILARTEMPIANGDTVFDVLTDAARQFRIHLEHDGGSGDMAYITAINNLYEHSYGELSGWVYTVNGARHSIGCGAYVLMDGDEVVWHYTLELGEDIQ